MPASGALKQSTDGEKILPMQVKKGALGPAPAPTCVLSRSRAIIFGSA
jgi:hypothetical protein